MSMENPTNLSDEQLQEILERSHGSTGDKILVLMEQDYRKKQRISDLETENVKLHEAGQALMLALKKYPEAATPGMPLHGERTRGIEDAYKGIKAALGKGGGGE